MLVIRDAEQLFTGLQTTPLATAFSVLIGGPRRFRVGRRTFSHHLQMSDRKVCGKNS